ncbi:MAG TPA: hypothetical protein DCF68_05955 [Cyanothece sp. UBA12306]|nr:hypothetical protein [Cyanothece sp. UBA12306]
MSQNSPKTWQKVVVIVSGLALLGVMVFPMMGSLNQSSSSEQQNAANSNATPEEQLKSMVQGYEKVLEREPNNPTALQGLMEARLQLIELEKRKLRNLQANSTTSVPESSQKLSEEGLEIVKVIQEQSKAVIDQSEKVLAKEPNNAIALQGLVKARLQLNDLKGAIAPMEKLVSLYPQEQQLATVLKTMKEELEKQKNPTPQPSPETNQDQEQN